MTNLPNIAHLADPGATEDQFQAAITALVNFSSEGMGCASLQALSIASDIITPSKGGVVIDTEGSLPVDNLARIIPTNFPDGRYIVVKTTSANRVITMKHLATGSGQMFFNTEADVVMDDARKVIVLRYNSTLNRWEEVYRNWGLLTYNTADVVAVNAALGIQTPATKQFSEIVKNSSSNTIITAVPELSKTAGYTAASGDRGKVINCSGTFTLAVTSAVTLGADWYCYVMNSGTGTITVDPSGSETINGVATITLSAKQSCMIISNGTNLIALLGQGSSTPDDNSITTAMIKNGQVTTAKLASDVTTWISGLVNTGSARLWDNVSYLAFKVAEANGLTIFKMRDMVSDEFEDETGINTAGSTGQTYDATNDWYSNLSSTSYALSGSLAGWNVNVGSYSSISGATVSITTTGIMHVSTTPVLAGDFDYSYTQGNESDTASSYGDAFQFGFASSGASASSPWYANAAGYIYLSHNGVGASRTVNLYSQRTSLGAWTGPIASGDVFMLRRRGSTFYVFKNGSLIITSASGQITANGYALFSIGATTTQTYRYNNINYTAAIAVADMALVSHAFTAQAAPSDARLVLWADLIGSVTLNTDLKAWVSRDNGTTWTQITLSQVATDTGGSVVLAGSASLTGQPNGTSMRYKITTHNGKELRIRAASLQWS